MTDISAFPTDAPTSEADWIHLIGQAPELPLSMRPVVVLSPHPDDESLAVGGLLAELRARDVSVTVVAVTDGEASHPGQPGLGARRVREQVAAVRELGIVEPIVRLGLPDAGVAARVDEVGEVLAELCDPETMIVAPWEHDGHTDHDACGAVARQVAGDLGAALFTYPVWAYQWARPSDLEALPLRRVTLPEEARSAKARALACYPSQITDETGPAIVGAEALARFLRPWEVLIDVR